MSHPAVDEYLAQFRKPVIPRFETKPIHMVAASDKAGRPIYEDREFVQIMVVGERGFSAYEPVSEEHMKRWPEEYRAFKEGKEAPLSGTPLADWPTVTRSRVEELAFFHIRTVEDLAGVNDAQLQKVGMGSREQREKARTFLEVAAKGTAPLERLVSENMRLKDEMLRLTLDLTEANSRAGKLEEELKNARAAA